MVESDPLSEENKTPRGHKHTNGVVYSKINLKVDICLELYKFRYRTLKNHWKKITFFPRNTKVKYVLF